MTSTIFKSRITLCLTVFILSACGGGGGGGGSSSDVPPLAPAPSPAVELSGTALLGTISNGIVTIWNIDGIVLAESVTNDTGSYGPVVLPTSHTGPVVVEITPALDGSSFFVCDFPSGCPSPIDDSYFPFGDHVPYTTTLSAVLPDISNVNTANVNPITTAIRARAETLGLSAENIIEADAEMSAELTVLLGVAIPTNLPTIPNIDLVNASIDVSIDEDVIAAGVNLSMLNAGLISLVTEESGYDSIDDVVIRLSASFAENGQFGISEEFNVSEIQSGELLFAMEQQIIALVEEQAEASALVQELVPDNSLQATAENLSQIRNEIAYIPPKISGVPTVSVAEDSSYSFTPTAVDPDGDLLTFSIANQPSWSDFNVLDGTLSGIPDNNAVGTVTDVRIAVSDGFTTVYLTRFDLEVTNTNDAPTISGIPVSIIVQDAEYNFAPTAQDIDVGATLTFSVQNLPTWAVFDTGSGSLTGIPVDADVGIDPNNIILSVSDGEETASLEPFSITVINVNDPPVISGTPPTTGTEDIMYFFSPVANDPDLDSSDEL